MRELFILILHLITIFIHLAKPGGQRAIVAESVLAKHPLLILNRSRRPLTVSAFEIANCS
jgi:hypothetical protein